MRVATAGSLLQWYSISAGERGGASRVGIQCRRACVSEGRKGGRRRTGRLEHLPGRVRELARLCKDGPAGLDALEFPVGEPSHAIRQFWAPGVERRRVRGGKRGEAGDAPRTGAQSACTGSRRARRPSPSRRPLPPYACAPLPPGRASRAPGRAGAQRRRPSLARHPGCRLPPCPSPRRWTRRPRRQRRTRW